MSKKTSKSKTKKPTRATAASEPTTKSRRLVSSLLLVLVAMSVGVFVYLSRSPEPPSINEKDTDVAIVAAIDSARRDVIASPKSGRTWGKLGMVFLAHGFSNQAEKSFTEAERLDQKNPMWPYLHARAVDENRPKEAIEFLTRSVSLCGNDPEMPRLFLVELLLAEQRLDEAERHLGEFLGQDKENVRAQHALARLHFMRGEFQECKDTIINMNNQIRDRYTVQKQRAESLARQGMKNDASIQIKKANRRLTLDLCKQRTIGELLANAMRRLGETESAEKQLKLAQAQSDRSWADPYSSQVVELRTGLKAMLIQSDKAFGAGDIEKSINILQTAIQQYPESLFAHVYLGRAHIRLGRTAFSENRSQQSKEHYRLAISNLEKALELDPNSVEALFRLGVAYVDQAGIDGDVDKFSKAESLYRRAIEQKPDFTMAYYNLSNALDRQGMLTEAIDAMQNVIRLEPQRGEACYRLGTLLVKAGNLTEAEKHLRLAIELDPANAVAREELRKLKEKITLP